MRRLHVQTTAYRALDVVGAAPYKSGEAQVISVYV